MRLMRYVTMLLLWGFCTSLSAQRIPQTLPDSSPNPLQRKLDRIPSTRLYQITAVAVPLIAAGLIVQGTDRHFQELRNDFLPSFNNSYDDYLQFAPGALMLGLKLGGVEGRSSWGRMLTSDAFAGVIMAGLVEGLKYSTHVQRPDGSDFHSFPSGHTALAFMTATMLHKEYGLTRSPWYSIGGYTMATAVGLSRQMNNKHWLSDVLVGAGIGILSAELGYFLADLIFKDRGILRNNRTEDPFDRNYRPSFLSLYLGFNLSPGSLQISKHLKSKMLPGSNVGAEGAWFWNRHFGVGSRLTLSNMRLMTGNTMESESLNIGMAMAGIYFSAPITPRWLIGSKLLGGYNYSPTTLLQHDLRIGKTGGAAMGTGFSLTYRSSHNFGMRFLGDYNLLHPASKAHHGVTHIFTLGGAATMLF